MANNEDHFYTINHSLRSKIGNEATASNLLGVSYVFGANWIALITS